MFHDVINHFIKQNLLLNMLAKHFGGNKSANSYKTQHLERKKKIDILSNFYQIPSSFDFNMSSGWFKAAS